MTLKYGVTESVRTEQREVYEKDEEMVIPDARVTVEVNHWKGLYVVCSSRPSRMKSPQMLCQSRGALEGSTAPRYSVSYLPRTKNALQL